ncbi:MAG: hypothetical protein UY07_C0027G0001, partial [Parcubacteria group bacterium GW2011_GWA1_47_8]
MKRRSFFLLTSTFFVSVFISLFTFALSVSAQTTQVSGGVCGVGGVPTWTHWETTLTSSKIYSNPYADVKVQVTYTGPNGQTINGYAFWDGDNTFRLRAMFSTVGTWSWITTSSDTSNAGLHNRSGVVQAVSYCGTNSLYQHGYLKISANKRYLTYGDGTPFLWLGDTAWSAPIAGTQAEWESYVQKRKDQKFTVIQVGAGTGFLSRTKDRNGNAPFTGTGSAMKWNPAYWQEFEKKVRYANDQGLIVFITAVRELGLGFPATGADSAQVDLFAQNLAARLMGSFVVYSTFNDYWWTFNDDVAGNKLQTSTSVHLVSVHPEFTWQPAVTFHGKEWTDFAGVQSGAGWQHNPHLEEPTKPFSAELAIQQAIEFSLGLYNQAPTKPVINMEGPYDAKGLQEGNDPRYLSNYPVRAPRSVAYLSMLSGAKGFTYGANGIWNWGTDVSWIRPAWTFYEALNQTSATQMKYLFDFFSGMNWWDLVPSHNLVKNQSTNPLTKMVVSKTVDGNLGVAYLQNNTNIILDMTAFAGTMSALWFNPVTSMWQDDSLSVPNVGTYNFVKPSAWGDALLVLKRPTSSNDESSNGGILTTSNIIPDPSMELGTQVWRPSDYGSTVVNTVARTGTRSIKLTHDGTGSSSNPLHNITQAGIPGVTPGAEYVYTVYVRGDNIVGNGAGGKPLSVLRWRNGAGTALAKEMYMWAPYGTYSWMPMTIYLQAPSTAQKIDAGFRSWWDVTGGNSYWDDTSLDLRAFPNRGSLLASYQSESGTVSNGLIETAEPDYTGSGYLKPNDGGYVEWTTVSGGTSGGARIISARYSYEGMVKPVELFVNGISQGQQTPVATGRTSSWASLDWAVNLNPGNNTVRLKAIDFTAGPMLDKIDVYARGSGGGSGGGQGGQSPYGGAPWTIPGKIEAENYDMGGAGIAYADTTLGNAGSTYRSDDVDIWSIGGTGEIPYVGTTAAGEWLEYTVNVATAG